VQRLGGHGYEIEEPGSYSGAERDVMNRRKEQNKENGIKSISNRSGLSATIADFIRDARMHSPLTSLRTPSKNSVCNSNGAGNNDHDVNMKSKDFNSGHSVPSLPDIKPARFSVLTAQRASIHPSVDKENLHMTYFDEFNEQTSTSFTELAGGSLKQDFLVAGEAFAGAEPA
jgi:hypothetical protein